MNDIGQVVATYPSIAAMPSARLCSDDGRPGAEATALAIAAGSGFSVIDPASLKPLLSMASDDAVSVHGVSLDVAQAMDWAIYVDRCGHVPIVTDEGQLGGIPPRSLRRRSPGTTLRPDLAAAFQARLDRWDAERALTIAIGADTSALLKLAA